MDANNLQHSQNTHIQVCFCTLNRCPGTDHQKVAVAQADSSFPILI